MGDNIDKRANIMVGTVGGVGSLVGLLKEGLEISRVLIYSVPDL